MGHQSIGALPKSKEFRAIVNQIAMGAEGGFYPGKIAELTLKSVRKQFDSVEAGGSMEAAFTFLVDLARSAQNPVDASDLFALLPEDAVAATPLKVARALRDATSKANDSAELRALADGAGADAIAIWFERNRSQQSLFPDERQTHLDVWHKAGDGSGFCELSRIYFSKFIERYLNYFLEREASAVISSIGKRDRFEREMKANVDDISRHAFETARITQSYAAGWFNKHAVEGKPTKEAIRSFLSHVFDKLRHELRQEEQKH